MGHGTFQWGLVDHALVGLKLSELSEEALKTTQAEENQIRFDNRQNQNSQAVPALLVKMHERRTDEYIEKTYQVYCDVWEKQGYTKTAEFVRAVAAHTIPVIIAGRTSAVRSQFSMERARTGAHIEPHTARMASFERSMQRLAVRWARKLEIEARECEHAESATRRSQHQEDGQRENRRKAILGLRVKIEAINRQLDNLPPPGSLSQYGQPIRISQQSIAKLIQRRLDHEAVLAELEAEDARTANGSSSQNRHGINSPAPPSTASVTTEENQQNATSEMLATSPSIETEDHGSIDSTISHNEKSDALATNQNTMRFTGDTWEVSYFGKEGNAQGSVKDIDGMRYYALLISETLNGSSNISAEELVRLRDMHFSKSPAGGDREDGQGDFGVLSEDETAVGDLALSSNSYQETYEPNNRMATRKGLDSAGHCNDVTDQKALNDYRRRIEEIDLELGSFRVKPSPSENDFARMEQLEIEKDQIAEHLRRSIIPGFGGARSPQFSNSGERARVLVKNAMERAIKRMRRHRLLKPLAGHLESSVDTGKVLSYNGPHDWRIDLPTGRKS